MNLFKLWSSLLTINMVIVIVLAFADVGETYAIYVDGILVVLGVIGFYYFYLVAKEYGLDTVNGKVLFLFSLEILFLLIGDAIWFYFEILKQIEPFPSIADLFYLIAYIPSYIAFIIRIKEFEFKPKTYKIIFYGSVLLIFTLFSILGVMIPIIKYSESSLELWLSISYPILDIFLVFLALLVASYYSKGLMEEAWLWIAGFNFVYALADTVFAYEDWQETYSIIGFNFSDFLYVLAPSLAILAAIKFLQLFKK